MGDYCTVADVQRILGNPDAFSGSTNPTSTQVESFISSAEEKVEKATLHAWRTTTVTDEYYDIPIVSNSKRYQVGVPIYLKNKSIKTIDGGEGDKIEVWNGSAYEDWVSTKTEGRNEDYWLDYNRGVLYLKTHYLRGFGDRRLRLTYRYGEASVPEDITEATALKVAIMLVTNDDRTGYLDDTGQGNGMNHDTRVMKWKSEYKSIIRKHARYRSVS